ncbi:MAG: hypothetical protein QOG97_75 [Acidimicrobiaceae bacterium]|nr:hypothetical protein [Acidimicrobiaceae bacterium]
MVTPEAVVLDVRTAGLGSRAFARAIDGLIQGVALIVVFLFTGILVSSTDGNLGTAALVIDLVVITVIIFGYPIILESLWRGRTPGKAALGLRVVTRQGAPIRFRHALVRGLIGLGEVTALPAVGVLSMLISTNDQRLGDMAGGTIVIRERAAAQMSVPVVFYPPPGWEPFVESLDVSAMTSAEYETVRSFLIRAHEMAPLPRANLAARLAGPLVARWHQPVPEGAGPELWLACAASAYQRRHGAPASPYGTGAWGPPHPGALLGGAWGPPQQQPQPRWPPPQQQPPPPPTQPPPRPNAVAASAGFSARGAQIAPPASPPDGRDAPAPGPGPGPANGGFAAPD